MDASKVLNLFQDSTLIYIYFFDNPGCPGQLTRTTTNPRIH